MRWGASDAEDTFGSVGGDGSHSFWCGGVDLCQALDDESEKCRFVAFAAMRGRSQVGCVRFDDYAFKWDDAFQNLWQRTFPEGDNAADTQCEALEAEQFASFCFRASEAVENSSVQQASQGRKHFRQFGMCGA